MTNCVFSERISVVDAGAFITLQLRVEQIVERDLLCLFTRNERLGHHIQVRHEMPVDSNDIFLRVEMDDELLGCGRECS